MCMLKYDSWRRYAIVDSMANGVGLPGLEIGWEETSNIMAMRIPGSLERAGGGADVV